jgi:phosphonate transport system substrate-binding protein
MSVQEPVPPQPSPKPFSSRTVLVLLLLLVLAGGAFGAAYVWIWSSVPALDYGLLIRTGVLSPTHLDKEYADADGDLVADPPADPGKQANPDTLVFVTLEGSLDRAQSNWKEFVEHLEKVTGKKVELQEKSGSALEDLAKLREHKVHLIALSTGTVPTGVNTAGFVPDCVMADAGGHFGYQMEILVPRDSPVQSPGDLKGKTIALGSLSSLSSYKGPVVLLWKEHGLYPGRDYDYVQTSAPKAVEGVCKKEYVAAPVANDFLQRILQEAEEAHNEAVGDTKFRSIYKSPQTYPPQCFGHAHDLQPDLAKKVKEAFLTFNWSGTALEAAYKRANQTKFVAVSYKDDWKAVREIDEAMNGLVEKKR